jgi:hypothetical protein
MRGLRYFRGWPDLLRTFRHVAASFPPDSILAKRTAYLPNSNSRCRNSSNRCRYSYRRCRCVRHTCRRWPSCPWRYCPIWYSRPPQLRLSIPGSIQPCHSPSSNVACRRSCCPARQLHCPTAHLDSSPAASRHKFRCRDCRLALRFCFRKDRTLSHLAQKFRYKDCRKRRAWPNRRVHRQSATIRTRQ